METMSIAKSLTSVLGTVSASRSSTEEGLGQDERDPGRACRREWGLLRCPTRPLQVPLVQGAADLACMRSELYADTYSLALAFVVMLGRRSSCRVVS
jgi:hypothetical protein